MRIGFSSEVYEVAEFTGSVNVQVVKNGSSDISISVLLHTAAGTALSISLHGMNNEHHTTYEVNCAYVFSLPQLVTIGH